MRILLAEDERRLAMALTHILQQEGFHVDTVGDGVAAADHALTGLYDIIVLDWMMPGRAGIDVVKDMRRAGITSSVIFLTAKDAVRHRIEGLDAGADDYLVKPFAKDELLARIRALSRRPDTLADDATVSAGRLTLNYRECTAAIGEATVALTPQETRLLEYLIRNLGLVVTKDQILAKVWAYDSDADHGSVELYVHYLRKKLAGHDTGVALATVRGVGYSLKVLTGDDRD
jgi:DNA-binding response OmpR family regulator